MALSATGMAEAFKETSTVAWRLLLTIRHADLAAPLRICDGRESVTSNGNLFVPYPFEFILPGDDGQRVIKARIRIDNIDREIFEAIWGLDPAPTISGEAVLATTPDVVEYASGSLRLERLDVDALTIEGDLAPHDLLSEPYPGRTVNQTTMPGVF